MRVIHLAGYSAPYPGSFIPMLRAVADAVTRRGWSFEACFPPAAASRQWYADLASDGCLLHSSPGGDRRSLTTWLDNILADQAEQPTLLHTHFTTFDLPASAVALRNPRVRVFWHLHTPLHAGVGPSLRNVVKFVTAGRRVETMLCVSADIGRAARRRGAPASRLIVFPNAIDLERFRPATAQERIDARVALSLPSDTPVLVHFGWDWERKGGDLFLGVVDALQRDGVDAQGLCVGGGGPARQAIDRLGIGGRVRVVESEEDVRAFYLAADIFIAPSHAEGMPYSMLEALCTGTPVVASDIQGHLSIAEGSSQCVLAASNPQAFAQAVRSLLTTASDERMPSDIEEFAASFDVRAWAQRLVDLYARKR